MASSNDLPNERQEDEIPANWIEAAGRLPATGSPLDPAEEPPIREASVREASVREAATFADANAPQNFEPGLATDLKEEFVALYQGFVRVTGGSTAAYQVPKRFGMGPLMGMMLLYSLIFAGLRWGNAPHWVYLFLGLLGVVIGFGQMQGQSNPRFSSILTGAVALPGCMMAYLLFIGLLQGGLSVADFLGGVCASIGLFFAGAFVGYLVGTVLAGVFLVGDQAEQAFYRWTGQTVADVSDHDVSHRAPA
ncbi:MAG TPA: hypothetical protein VGN57_18515 [Pirellulaceae bacterium]|jgi:hypothetical protein|nr:hypothetical protein [Pirellulaceae bacterium]